jgi:hypothetical protein
LEQAEQNTWPQTLYVDEQAAEAAAAAAAAAAAKKTAVHLQWCLLVSKLNRALHNLQ